MGVLSTLDSRPLGEWSGGGVCDEGASLGNGCEDEAKVRLSEPDWWIAYYASDSNSSETLSDAV